MIASGLQKLRGAFLLVLLAGLALEQYPGCKKDEAATAPPADTGGIAGRYGKGSISFDATGGGGHFSATGKYKPSDQFANDTSGEGAGGFVADTALYGRKIQSMLTGYTHLFVNNTLTERLIVITLYDSSGKLTPRSYPFSRLNSRTAGQAAYVYFFLSDSSNLFQMFVPKSGALTLLSYDTTARHAIGNFSGTLWGSPPDTSIQMQIRNGNFDIYFSDSYFNY